MTTIAVGADGDIDPAFVLVDGLEAVRQRVLQRLAFVRGEWFLDTGAGVPYYEEIFNRPHHEGLAAQVIAQELARLPLVQDVQVRRSSTDALTRRLHVEFQVDTDFGAVIVDRDL